MPFAQPLNLLLPRCCCCCGAWTWAWAVVDKVKFISAWRSDLGLKRMIANDSHLALDCEWPQVAALPACPADHVSRKLHKSRLTGAIKQFHIRWRRGADSCGFLFIPERPLQRTVITHVIRVTIRTISPPDVANYVCRVISHPKFQSESPTETESEAPTTLPNYSLAMSEVSPQRVNEEGSVCPKIVCVLNLYTT